MNKQKLRAQKIPSYYPQTLAKKSPVLIDCVGVCVGRRGTTAIVEKDNQRAILKTSEMGQNGMGNRHSDNKTMHCNDNKDDEKMKTTTMTKTRTTKTTTTKTKTRTNLISGQFRTLAMFQSSHGWVGEVDAYSVGSINVLCSKNAVK